MNNDMKTDYELIKEFLSKFEDNELSIDVSFVDDDNAIIIEATYVGYEDGTDILYNIKKLNHKYEVIISESSYSPECGTYEDEQTIYLDDINAVIDYLSTQFSDLYE